MLFDAWFKDDRKDWEIEFEKLQHWDFERLGVEKEKLYNILETLHKWKVIR
jgi:hypothetical protein